MFKSIYSIGQKKVKLDVVGLVLPGIILALWYIVTANEQVPQYLLPPPQQLYRAAVDFAAGNWHITPYSGTLGGHALASASRVFKGFGLAVLLGLPLGLLTGRIQLLKRFIDPTVQLIRTIPGIGWLPLAMIWLGVGEGATIFLIALAAFFPIYINAAQGAGNVSPLLLRAAQMLGANRVSLFTTVILPASLPSVIAGLRLGLGLSWAYLVLGELTGVNQGLGAVMMDARMLGHVDVIMVTMIYIAIFGWLTDSILMSVFRLLQARLGGA